jgi:hypothetical protein
MWGLWLALDCLDDEAVAAVVLISSDSQWPPNALKESGYSAHSVLAPLRAIRVVYASNGSLLIAAFSETRGRMRRPGRLPTLALPMCAEGEDIL